MTKWDSITRRLQIKIDRKTNYNNLWIAVIVQAGKDGDLNFLKGSVCTALAKTLQLDISEVINAAINV